jgi:hypothetical protein
MASRPARPEDFDVMDAPFSFDHLLNQLEGWNSTLLQDTDDYDLITKTLALYRFALKNYNEPGRDLLLHALKAFEDAEDNRRH